MAKEKAATEQTVNNKKMHRFGEFNEKIEFHTDLPKVEFDDVIGIMLEIQDAKLIRDFDSRFGKHDFMIVHAVSTVYVPNADDGTECQDFTFGTSGMVLIKRIMKMQEDRKLPLLGVIEKAKDKQYYDIS
jgi:hypothetical protein